ncbi:hypothetical protein, partial [Streptomyces sp. NPDC000405]|uniref:hypothetical protein n=1 Tax=Streptomyces sp. NPDC000405 TaxID=3161033 RepID=UPI00398CF155
GEAQLQQQPALQDAGGHRRVADRCRQGRCQARQYPDGLVVCGFASLDAVLTLSAIGALHETDRPYGRPRSVGSAAPEVMSGAAGVVPRAV